MEAPIFQFPVRETAFSSKGILQIHQVAPDMWEEIRTGNQRG